MKVTQAPGRVTPHTHSQQLLTVPQVTRARADFGAPAQAGALRLCSHLQREKILTTRVPLPLPKDSHVTGSFPTFCSSVNFCVRLSFQPFLPLCSYPPPSPPPSCAPTCNCPPTCYMLSHLRPNLPSCFSDPYSSFNVRSTTTSPTPFSDRISLSSVFPPASVDVSISCQDHLT